MPAKEQSGLKQVKDSQYNDESLSNASSSDSPTSIIRKLYGAVLDNSTVKYGMKRINRISQPLLDKYHEVLVEGRQQVDEIRKLGEGVYTSTTEHIKTWCYSITIYNHLVGLWLIKNLPFDNEKVVSLENFLESFQSISKDVSEESRKTVENFYREANEHWIKMKNPDLEDIKASCLHIAARAIASDYGLEIENYPSALVELFYTLTENKDDIVTEEVFYALTARKVHTEAENQPALRRATKDFYTFAKRFAFLEFPLTYANQDLLRVLYKFTREKVDTVSEAFLRRVDTALDAVIRNFGVEVEAREEPINVLDRFHQIIYKLRTIGAHATRKTRLAIQDSRGYKALDNRIHFENRSKDLDLVYQYISQLTIRTVGPTYEAITYSYNKITKEYLVTLRDVSTDLAKEKIATLKQKYSALKDATFVLKDKVLEVRLSRETIKKYGQVAYEQLLAAYGEVRRLDRESLKVYGGKAYQRALEAVKQRSLKPLVASEQKESTENTENQSQKQSQTQESQQ